MANNPLKPEYSRYGSFDRLADLCEEQVHDLVTELAEKNQQPGSIAAKVKDLYMLGLDSARLNTEGVAPIAADRSHQRNFQIPAEAAALMGRLQAEGLLRFFISMWVPTAKTVK